jgi:N-6 DNA Methylase
MPLFHKKLLLTTINNHRVEINSEFKALLKEHFESTLQRIESKSFGKEESEKVPFLQKMFELLGYKMHENLEFEYSMEGRSIDAVLGHKTESKREIEVAIEWKGIDTKNLDKGKAGETPVSQLWDYITKSGSPIGILGNFLEFRLYIKSKKQSDYHEFKLSELVGDNSSTKLDELIVLLNPRSLLRGGNKTCRIESLIEQSQTKQEQITKEFYRDYKALRLQLFQDLVLSNHELSKHFVLEKTQKLLDRLIFVMFCEDTQLLPREIIKNTYALGKASRSRSTTKTWEEFQYLFDDIDKGRHDIYPQINAFNGGLFKSDDQLNNLVIAESIWESIVKLSEYDFASDLNVNILGHIFEQSISDLEDIKAQIEAEEIVTATTVSPQEEQNEDEVTASPSLPQEATPQSPTSKAKTSKRKKNGIYYTPEYITDYIVEQTVGKYLLENPGCLETITVLDPAGGSGAFPNQVHSFLAKQHADIFNQKAIDDGLEAFAESDDTLVDKSILKNNIFMVDLQPESVEIAKLSLWLKTARKDQKLDNLDSNIKCGNSLIDDPEIAGELAFDWGKEFGSLNKNSRNK